MSAQVPAHAWVTTDTGLLKSVNLAKRTATNFYDGAQPTKSEAIKHITNPTKNSLLTISQTGKVKQFEDGKFNLLYDSGISDPVFLHQITNVKQEQSDSNTNSIVHCYKTGEVFLNQEQIYKAKFKDEG